MHEWFEVVHTWQWDQLFNGDFVDRGSFSVECIFTLLSYKLLYPSHFYMSRGMACQHFHRSSVLVICWFTVRHFIMRLLLLYVMCYYLLCWCWICVAGNHESETMNQMYGFEGEVKSKYPFISSRFNIWKDAICIFLCSMKPVLCTVVSLSSDISESRFRRTVCSWLLPCLSSLSCVD